MGGAAAGRSTADGLERIFQVNVLAPYLLTALMARPARLVYLTSGLEAQGRVDLDDLQHAWARWDGEQAYSDSKLCDLLLAFAVARRWPEVLANAVDPGWIRTRMGGSGAPDPLPLGAETPVWLGDQRRAGGDRQRSLLQAPPPAPGQSRRLRRRSPGGLAPRCAALTGVTLPR